MTSDAENKMEGVVVSAKRAGSTMTVSVISDAQGRYVFPQNRLEPGSYAVRIRATGFDLESASTVNVTAGKTSQLDLKLKKTQDDLKATQDELAMTKADLETTKESLRAKEMELEKAKMDLVTAQDALNAAAEQSRKDLKSGGAPEVGAKMASFPGGTGFLATGAAAYRWKTDVEENAKRFALAGTLPEMNHNEIEAWQGPAAKAMHVVLLRDAAEPPEIAQRFHILRDMIGPSAGGLSEARGHGAGRLARLLTLAYLGQWTSYYLAVLRGRDPWSVPLLDEFKRRVRRP